MDDHCTICNEKLSDEDLNCCHAKCWLAKNNDITADSKPHMKRLYLAFFCSFIKMYPHQLAAQYGVKLKHASEYEDEWSIKSQMWDMEVEEMDALLKAISETSQTF